MSRISSYYHPMLSITSPKTEHGSSAHGELCDFLLINTTHRDKSPVTLSPSNRSLLNDKATLAVYQPGKKVHDLQVSCGWY